MEQFLACLQKLKRCCDLLYVSEISVRKEESPLLVVALIGS